MRKEWWKKEEAEHEEKEEESRKKKEEEDMGEREELSSYAKISIEQKRSRSLEA